MHELGLCSSIVDAIERRAGDRPVARVRVQVGRPHHVHPEAFDQSFAVAALGTVAQDAAAELVPVPVRLEDEDVQPGDWVLIHVGFALSKIDEREASLALASLQLLGQAYDDELEAFWSSNITTDSTGG
jgi:hydrogenase assembly chaperone HypC/HupF